MSPGPPVNNSGAVVTNMSLSTSVSRTSGNVVMAYAAMAYLAMAYMVVEYIYGL